MGSDAEVNGIYYKLNKSSKTAYVSYFRRYYTPTSESYEGKYKGNVNIPESFYYEGITYKVTAIDDNAFKGIEAIILSMTPKERTNPEILNTSRRMRIAKGSGTNVQDVNRLIKQFDQTRKMMKMVTGSKMSQMMGAMKGMKGMKR